MKPERTCDLLIVGGGVGGCAAALAAARLGRHVILTEETDWLGGQITAQAVSALDEHSRIESFGGTESYYRYRNGVRDYYRAHYPLTPQARQAKHLNPGNRGYLFHEPRVALAVLEAMFAPHCAARRVEILTEHRAVRAEACGDRVLAVELADLRHGGSRVVHAPFVIDATELGDLLPLTGTEYVSGAESQADTGEPHAVSGPPQPENVQSFTVSFIVDYLPGENHTVAKPLGYETFRDKTPISWQGVHPITLQPRTYSLFGDGGAYNLWVYRRVLDRTLFAEGAFPSDLTIINWPQSDYCWGNLIDQPPAEAARMLDQAKRLSLSLLYWLQSEAPRPDGGAGYPGVRLRPDAVGTPDGLAKFPYVRESRRIQPVFRVLEQHIASDLRKHAETFHDSVGIGHYRIDLHPSSNGVNYIDIGCCPFQVPLGALLPVRMRNLIPACKNIGSTHITNGAYRLHPVEWNIGEAAGALAAFCLGRRTGPHAVREKADALADFQALLRRLGVPLEWTETG